MQIKKHEEVDIAERTLINPIIPNEKSFFRIFKLSKDYDTGKFLNYNPEKYTIFIKLDKNYENFKNGH
jgi:hypothetical protein